MTRVLVLGGGGAMAQAAVASAAACSSIEEIVVADVNLAAAQAVAAPYAPQAHALHLDLFDEARLAAAVESCGAVINCAGPFYKTGLGPLKAAIAAGKIYLDICDDWEPMLEMLRLDEAARKAGVVAIVGIGAAPGVTNLLARIAADQMDVCARVVTGWSLDTSEGSILDAERNSPRGAHAAVTHWLHQLSGEIELWESGRRTRARPFQTIRLEPPGLPARAVYTIGHPEPLTLPLAIHGLESAAATMAMGPRDAAFLRAVARGVASGDLTMERGADLIVHPGEAPLGLRLRAGVAALAGNWASEPPYPALFAVAEGTKDGTRRRAAAWTTRLPEGLAAATGVPLAVALKLAVNGRIDRPGVFAPEQALDPYIFFEEFAARVECRSETAPLVHVESADLD